MAKNPDFLFFETNYNNTKFIQTNGKFWYETPDRQRVRLISEEMYLVLETAETNLKSGDVLNNREWKLEDNKWVGKNLMYFVKKNKRNK